MIRIPKKYFTFFASTLVTAALVFPLAAQAGSLENLERERALTLEALLDPDLLPSDRQEKIAGAG